MIKDIFFTLFNFLAVSGVYYVIIKYFLKIHWKDATGLIVVAFVGFVFGGIYYFKKRKEPNVSRKDVMSVLIAMVISFTVVVILFRWIGLNQ